MSFQKSRVQYKWVFLSNFFTFILSISFFFLMGLGQSQVFTNLEVQNLKIRSPESNENIQLVVENGRAKFLLNNQKNQSVLALGVDQQGGGRIKISGSQMQPSLFLQGGLGTGLYMKNQMNKMVGSWTVLKDGGSGMGMADSNGKAAAILRGGSNPSVTFFGDQPDPMAAIGMIQRVPHMLVSGKQGSEGILIHGGKPNSFVVVDESGKVKILISKEGVFQGKTKKEKAPYKDPSQKIFSYEDTSSFFISPEGME